MSGVAVTVCAQCGTEFWPKGFGWKFCSSACRNQANKLSVRQHMTAAILPSEQKPIRKEPMTWAEFDAYLDAERTKLNAHDPHPADLWWGMEPKDAAVRALKLAGRAEGGAKVLGVIETKTEAYSANG